MGSRKARSAWCAQQAAPGREQGSEGAARAEGLPRGPADGDEERGDLLERPVGRGEGEQAPDRGGEGGEQQNSGERNPSVENQVSSLRCLCPKY